MKFEIHKSSSDGKIMIVSLFKTRLIIKHLLQLTKNQINLHLSVHNRVVLSLTTQNYITDSFS